MAVSIVNKRSMSLRTEKLGQVTNGIDAGTVTGAFSVST